MEFKGKYVKCNSSEIAEITDDLGKQLMEFAKYIRKMKDNEEEKIRRIQWMIMRAPILAERNGDVINLALDKAFAKALRTYIFSSDEEVKKLANEMARSNCLATDKEVEKLSKKMVNNLGE